MSAAKELLRSLRRSGLSKDEQFEALFGRNYKQLRDVYGKHEKWDLNIPQLEEDLGVIVVGKKQPADYLVSDAKLYVVFPPRHQFMRFRPAPAYDYSVKESVYRVPLGWHAMCIRIDLGLMTKFRFSGIVLTTPTNHSSKTMDIIAFPSPNGGCYGDEQPVGAHSLRDCVVNNYEAFFASSFNFDDSPSIGSWYTYLLEQARGESWPVIYKQIRELMNPTEIIDGEWPPSDHEVYGDLTDEAFAQWEKYSLDEMVTLPFTAPLQKYTHELVGQRLDDLTGEAQ